ncbi:hypothetical protein [Mycobacterium sp. NPDC004974]
MSPAADAGAGLTRSKIENWDITHLEIAAARWRASADEFEELFAQHRQNISGTEWEGTAKDAAVDRVTADSAVVGRHGEVARAAADLADSSVADLQAAQRAALGPIADAEADGFRVSEEFRVADTRRIDVATMAARYAAAREHAENIQWNAEQLLATDTLIRERLQAKATELDGITFDGADNGTIQAASFGDGFKQSGGDEADPEPDFGECFTENFKEDIGKNMIQGVFVGGALGAIRGGVAGLLGGPVGILGGGIAGFVGGAAMGAMISGPARTAAFSAWNCL